MRLLFNIISVFMVTVVIFLAYLNIDTSLSFVIWKNINSSNFLVYHSRFFLIILMVFIVGMLAGTCWASTFYAEIERKLKEYQRKLERTCVNSGEESARVAVLEEKIKVLEKSLQSALDKTKDEEQ